MPRDRFTFEEWVDWMRNACQIKREVDRELGDAMMAAGTEEKREDWVRVHDRANVIGDFELADKVRELIGEDA